MATATRAVRPHGTIVARFAAGITRLECSGLTHEWHLVVPNSFRHFTFQHPARLHHLVELDWRAFSLTRFKTVRSIGDAMKCDGVEQLFVKGGSERRATASLKVNQRLKRLQRLQRP